jgi:hypothetical protein
MHGRGVLLLKNGGKPLLCNSVESLTFVGRISEEELLIVETICKYYKNLLT